MLEKGEIAINTSPTKLSELTQAIEDAEQAAGDAAPEPAPKPKVKPEGSFLQGFRAKSARFSGPSEGRRTH